MWKGLNSHCFPMGNYRHKWSANGKRNCIDLISPSVLQFIEFITIYSYGHLLQGGFSMLFIDFILIFCGVWNLTSICCPFPPIRQGGDRARTLRQSNPCAMVGMVISLIVGVDIPVISFKDSLLKVGWPFLTIPHKTRLGWPCLRCLHPDYPAPKVVGRKTGASYVLRIALQKRPQVVSLGWHFLRFTWMVWGYRVYPCQWFEKYVEVLVCVCMCRDTLWIFAIHW